MDFVPFLVAVVVVVIAGFVFFLSWEKKRISSSTEIFAQSSPLE